MPDVHDVVSPIGKLLSQPEADRLPDLVLLSTRLPEEVGLLLTEAVW